MDYITCIILYTICIIMYLYVEFRINNFTIVNLMLSFVFIFADVVFLEVLDCTFCPGFTCRKNTSVEDGVGIPP